MTFVIFCFRIDNRFHIVSQKDCIDLFTTIQPVAPAIASEHNLKQQQLPMNFYIVHFYSFWNVLFFIVTGVNVANHVQHC